MFTRAARYVGLLAVLGLAAPGRAATLSVAASPGDTGTIEFPICAAPTSSGPAAGVQITVTAPPYFTVLSSSTLGPVDIAEGTTQTFRVNYKLDVNAAFGVFVATLTPSASIYNIVPRLDTLTSWVSFTVQPPVFAGKAVSADASGNIWEVFGSSVQYGAAKYTSAGVFVSSTPIPNASNWGAWALRFDGSGNAYAVGTSSGPQSLKNDSAVYQVSSAGNVLLGSSTYNNALNGDDIAYDAAGGLWIAGKIPNALGGCALALWSVNPQTGLISLTTSYSGPGGVDAGTGIVLDVSSNVWVVGFSSNPATSGANKLDLALWKFDSTGSSLTAGPFRRSGYMWNPERRVAANIIAASTSTLVVSASRLNTLGNTDLAVLSWDLYGNLISTKAWHGTNGGDQTPRGLAFDGSGNLLVVGNSSGTLGFWTYSSTGAFVSAQTASTGTATGITVSGGDTWLAMDSSTYPYKWTGGTALSGAEGIGGGIGSLGLPGPLLASLADFYYRDIYAFPNPARRNRGVTIRSQVGLADSINIHIYDISGQLVNQGSPGDPRLFDDGNGKGVQYTYDYNWGTGSVGSGVYIYAVTAKKGGNADIRKTKKVAIIK